MALFFGAFFLRDLTANAMGVALAALSDAVTSGVGYVIWYAALPELTPTKAANVQLSVPAIAALGGVILLSETSTVRLVIASTAILCGIAMVLSQRRLRRASSGSSAVIRVARILGPGTPNSIRGLSRPAPQGRPLRATMLRICLMAAIKSPLLSTR